MASVRSWMAEDSIASLATLPKMPPPLTWSAGSGFGLARRAAAPASAAKRRAARIAAMAAGCNKHYRYLPSGRSGRRARRPVELLANGCVAADANLAAPAVARPPVQGQLMQDQNGGEAYAKGSCKLELEQREEIRCPASREECSDAYGGWCLEACGI